eukprot:9718-Heterococcus_DN1.PRE.2
MTVAAVSSAHNEQYYPMQYRMLAHGNERNVHLYCCELSECYMVVFILLLHGAWCSMLLVQAALVMIHAV